MEVFGTQSRNAMAAKATLQSDRRMSSLPLNADIYRGDDHVSFGRPVQLIAKERLVKYRVMKD